MQIFVSFAIQSTRDHSTFPWPMLVPTLTDLNFSSPLLKHLGWMDVMSFLEKFLRERMLSSVLRRKDPTLVRRKQQLQFLTPVNSQCKMNFLSEAGDNGWWYQTTHCGRVIIHSLIPYYSSWIWLQKLFSSDSNSRKSKSLPSREFCFLCFKLPEHKLLSWQIIESCPVWKM